LRLVARVAALAQLSAIAVALRAFLLLALLILRAFCPRRVHPAQLCCCCRAARVLCWRCWSCAASAAFAFILRGLLPALAFLLRALRSSRLRWSWADFLATSRLAARLQRPRFCRLARSLFLLALELLGLLDRLAFCCSVFLASSARAGARLAARAPARPDGSADRVALLHDLRLPLGLRRFVTRRLDVTGRAALASARWRSRSYLLAHRARAAR
jgi:hypothetical protein